MSPPQRRRRVRWIGPTDGPEFGPCYALLKQGAEVLPPASRVPVDLTVFTTPRPLADAAQLKAIVGDRTSGEVVQLLGAWCEGEGRTGRVVEGATRVFWHAFPSWWRALDAATDHPNPVAPVRVRVESQDAALAEALVVALAAEGLTAIWSRVSLVIGADAVAWDGRQLAGREADHLAAAAAAARWEAIPVVALLDFPRPETVAAARALGAAEVFGKPLDAARLAGSIRALTARLPRPLAIEPRALAEPEALERRSWAA